ncbi:MAG: hypothetical protein MZV49_21670 [Rhodopseudomonas palustris]|nr:hypothetical protein [Rhodopseudomonas palustris]
MPRICRCAGSYMIEQGAVLAADMCHERSWVVPAGLQQGLYRLDLQDDPVRANGRR